MKIYVRLIAGLSCFMVTTTFADPESDDKIVRDATSLSTLHRVTEKPHAMLDSTVELCAPPVAMPHNVHTGFLNSSYCHVYVNTTAKSTMLAGRGEYPVGSLIVKSKLRSQKAADIELFTVMRKMGRDYDPEHGNWEYSLIDGRARQVYARGKIASCVSCHDEYRPTDFVTRTYLK